MHELTIPKKYVVSKTQVSAPLSSPPARPAPDAGRRIQTRVSNVHGKGVFAVQDLAEGETLIEYVGEVITWKEALRRHPHDPKDPNHTFYFHIDEKHVIDAKYGGNSSRWINHSCNPNCEADEQDGRVFIKALRNIKAGDELFYDYGLIIDAPYTKKLLAEYPCWCGSPDCRGTLLAPKDEKPGKKKQKKNKPEKASGADKPVKGKQLKKELNQELKKVLKKAGKTGKTGKAVKPAKDKKP
ncbi:MAG: SET domain-containing protein-lysine N-methyltransferase [Polaromonas sp.]|uniref:SET domain-containing protein n=1 Tax=Polaromonas sp. TaxID=1869339 RepID=UPI00271EBB3D|nr:SET domain-containing protein-lysine N-methyltransferase [Polaromonas sp.]MDO9112775.1 SET domain-containing protein-lysine N-methyltransferase [Polaromonas sp.]MDP1887994.1 SET domain-containing protein-lysine N-methyltransferase [Polaromonas sp.]